jgi:hypothetical protein
MGGVGTLRGGSCINICIFTHTNIYICKDADTLKCIYTYILEVGWAPMGVICEYMYTYLYGYLCV